VNEAVVILRRELERAERELHSKQTELANQKRFLEEATAAYKGFLRGLEEAKARRDAFREAIAALSEVRRLV
jgi:hypothetical protein